MGEEPVVERWNFLPMGMVCSPSLPEEKSLANGGDTSTQHSQSGGAGSGGAIRLEGGSISIAGTLEAKGGNGLTATPGGGGRIAIKTNGNLTLGTIATGRVYPGHLAYLRCHRNQCDQFILGHPYF